MVGIKPLLIPLAVIAVAACASVSAQTDSRNSPAHVKILPAPVEGDAASGARVKVLPPTTALPSGVPFAIDSSGPRISHPIRVLAAGAMSQHDRDLAADAESSIQERAGFENLEFNQGGWTYQQLDCAALPNHLFLRFTRGDGARDMSMFTAAIPRNGDGRVHIIPIVRRGYSLFSPAPVGALTIAAFNRIRAEENSDSPADWLGTGLCYAALAGANPQVEGTGAQTAEDPDTRVNIEPTLLVTQNGGAIIRFADTSSDSHPMEWNMIFDNKGKLVKATHSAATAIRYRAHHMGPTDIKVLKGFPVSDVRDVKNIPIRDTPVQTVH